MLLFTNKTFKVRALFLDRDGVINIEKDGSYIFKPEELHFYDGALEAIAAARQHFDLVLVVTNQRGIGRGMMTAEALHEIHASLLLSLQDKGGHIEAFYFAPSADRDNELRKPNTGMALLAKADYPDIDFSRSVMIGNNLSDMEFGKKMGMHTVFLHTTKDKIALPHELIDEQYESLAAWAARL